MTVIRNTRWRKPRVGGYQAGEVRDPIPPPPPGRGAGSPTTPDLPTVQVWLDDNGRITSLQRSAGVEVTITRPDGHRTDLSTQAERATEWLPPQHNRTGFRGATS